MEKISREYCPIVMIDRYYKDCKLSYVTTDNYQGGVIATRKLLDAGHLSIACIQGEISSMPNFERVSGYMETMKEVGAEDRCLVLGKDISIISFDNNVSLRFFTPSVTMISQPVEDMAKVAVQILMKAIANPAGNSKGSQSFTHLRLSPSVIEGQSVGRL